MTELDEWGRITVKVGDDAAVQAAVAYHGIVEEHARANNGHLVERTWDVTLSVFSAAEEALVAAASIERALRTGDWLAYHPEKPALRAALHTGRLARPYQGQFGSPAMRVFRLCHCQARTDPGVSRNAGDG